MSSRDDAWLSSINGPSASMSPPRRASPNARTRAISVTACRPRGSSRTCSNVASRSAATPSRVPTATLSARRCAYGVAFERARHAGVDDEHAQLVGQREWLDLEGAAVDQQRVPGPPEHRRERVLGAARHAGGNVLGTLCGEREVEGREREAGGIVQRERHGHRERRARRQAAADRYRRRDVEIGAHRRAPEVGEHAHDARDRTAPRGLHRAGFVGSVGRHCRRHRRDPPSARRSRVGRGGAAR